ncbi:unnamed protein product [Caenorhabditis angaria]|uniref:GH18 domain-containing protein n=1 Tax=Caenorhabditis angaria TaxID=860376 RepID=A0A9P1IJ12_9PELO|nr:unnamed protein product [Caenorhabditis angaria]
MISILLFLSIFGLAESSINCYYTIGKPDISELPGKCDSYILIGSTRINNETGIFEANKEEVEKFSQLKQLQPNKKLLITILSSNPSFTKMSSNASSILKFSSDTLDFLIYYNLDGIDIDWEFPVWSSDANQDDRIYFRNLLEVLYDKYHNKGKLISVAVSGPPTITKIAYDVQALAKKYRKFIIFSVRYADMVQVMNYDFHVFSRKSNPLVGFNAPLHPLRFEFSLLAKMNSESSMNTWFSLGLPRNITYFGIPTYCRAFRLLSKYFFKPYSPAVSAIDEFTDYESVCYLTEKNSNYRKVWNTRAASPYLYGSDRLWISYENPESIRQKVTFAKTLGVAGIMVFSVGNDDFHGKCGQGKYPLINSIDF